MTDVSSNYLAGEHKMIETGKGIPGVKSRTKDMTKKAAITAADTDRDDRSVRSMPKSEKNASIAPSVKVDDDEKDSVVDSYASLRIAGSPRVKISVPKNDTEDVDGEGGFGSEEELEYSDGSAYEHGEDNDEDEVEDYESDGSFEDIDGGFSGYARIKVDGVEFDHGNTVERKFSPYARISVPDTTDIEHRKYIDRDFSPYARVSVPVTDNDKEDASYAKVSVAGSEIEKDAGYARVSVAGSEVDFNYGETNARISVAGSEGKEMDRESFTGFARVSRAGSEADQNYVERYTRVSIAGSDHGRDFDREAPAYARISVAGSDHARETERELSGYARVSVAGSEYEHGKDADKGFSSYARISVAGSEAGYRKDPEREFPGYARISAVKSEMEYEEDRENEYPAYPRVSVGDDRENEYSAYPRVSVGDAFIDLPSPGGSGFKIKKYENELYSESEKSEKELSVSGVVRDEDDGEDDVYEAYLELSPEKRAKLEYQVRVVLVCPIFESNKKLSSFSSVYRKKFGRDVEETGFGPAARLCRAMPHIVQRSRLEKDGELWLLDSAKNRRAVAGIRSGLRRIVYDVLKESSEKMSFEQLEEKCSEALGKPLVEILTEHGYDTPTVEFLVKDMPDLVVCEKDGDKKGALLCTDAEDPALSDGILLIKRSASSRSISYSPERKLHTELEHVQESPAELTTIATIIEPQLNIKPETLNTTPTRLTMRGLRKEIRRQDFNPCPASILECEILQARLCLRILLAFHNKGQGVEVSRLFELYESTFKRSLDLQVLGFRSVLDLAKSWNDIFLFHDNDPDWVFLVPYEANKRILNTLRTGLRSSVHAVMTSAAPDGLQLSDFLHHLQDAQHGKLWEVLQNSGYSCSEPGKLERFMNSKFQLADFEEIRLLLDDMMDFVRLGSDDDGCLVVKLNDSSEKAPKFPLLDLVDCKMEETDVGSFDELFVNLMLQALNGEEDDAADDASENGSKHSEGEVIAGGIPIPSGLVAQRVETFESGLPLRAAHSPTPASLRFKHEIRLILGSSEYSEKGVAWSDLNKVYKDRTGQELGSKTKVKKLLRDMPDVVCKESLTERFARLSKTAKNLRILAATRNGYRQVLWWASIFNSAGLWANLLEGWFLDLDGRSFAACLQDCGYEASKSRPLSPVSCFLKDMSDLLEKRFPHCEVYTWVGGVQDPVHQDATLLGVPEIMIQFDPSRGDTQSVQERVAALYRECEEKAAQKEDKSSEEDHQSDSSESDEVSSHDPAEKAVNEAEKHGFVKGPMEGRIELEIKVDHPSGKIEIASVDDITVSPPEVEEAAVVKNDIPEEIAEKSAVVENKAQEERLAGSVVSIVQDKNVGTAVAGSESAVVQDNAQEKRLADSLVSIVQDKTVGTAVAASQSPVEAVAADAVPLDEREERIGEFTEAVDAKPASYEERGHSEEDYNGDIEGDGDSGGMDNEDKKVFVSGSRDVKETDHERVYVLGGTSEDVRTEDERVYILGSSERLKVRKEEDGGEMDDSVAYAYAQLRVAGKGPAINLDEWQFTDSDEDYDAVDDDGDDDFEDEDEDGSGGSDAQPRIEQTQPRVGVSYQSSPDPKDSKKAWVLPSKGIHVK